MVVNIVDNISTMDLYHNIKAVRDDKGVSQAEMARRLDLDPSAYHRLEHRGNKLSVEQATRIATALGVSLLDLINWKDGKEENKSVLIDNVLSSELLERVKDLEDSNDDKKFIIRSFRASIRKVFLMLSVFIEQTGRHLNLGQIITDDLTDEEKVRDERSREKGATVIYPYILTNEEVYEIIEYVRQQNYTLYYLLEALTENEIMPEDYTYAEAFRRYARDRKRMMKG